EGSPIPAQTLFESCVNWLTTCPGIGDVASSTAPANTITRDGLTGTQGLTAAVACHPYNPPSCAPVSVLNIAYGVIWSARIRLKDVVAPILTAHPGGTLFESGGPLTGIATVSLGAADRGGGIQSVALIVDGTP